MGLPMGEKAHKGRISPLGAHEDRGCPRWAKWGPPRADAPLGGGLVWE